MRNFQAVLRGQAARSFRSVTRKADGALIDVTLALEPCLDHRGGVVAVKLRCERLLRSRPPAPPAFGVGSGTRPIPPTGGRVPTPPAPSSMRPPATSRGQSVPAAAPLSEPPTIARGESIPVRGAPVTSGTASVRALPSIPRAPALPSSGRASTSLSALPASPAVGVRSVPPKSGRVAVVKPPAPSTLVLTDDGAEQLETALQLLGWLRQRIEAANGPIDDERERARALVVLNETTELVAQCRCEMKREVTPKRSRG